LEEAAGIDNGGAIGAEDEETVKVPQGNVINAFGEDIGRERLSPTEDDGLFLFIFLKNLTISRAAVQMSYENGWGCFLRTTDLEGSVPEVTEPFPEVFGQLSEAVCGGVGSK